MTKNQLQLTLELELDCCEEVTHENIEKHLKNHVDILTTIFGIERFKIKSYYYVNGRPVYSARV